MTDTECSVAGCTRSAWVKGMCRMHYRRQWTTGTTDAPLRGSKPGDREESQRRRYAGLDACPRCHALPGNPCREEPMRGSRVVRPRTKPHPERPPKAPPSPSTDPSEEDQ